jgi:hypothetical protein
LLVSISFENFQPNICKLVSCLPENVSAMHYLHTCSLKYNLFPIFVPNLRKRLLVNVHFISLEIVVEQFELFSFNCLPDIHSVTHCVMSTAFKAELFKYCSIQYTKKMLKTCWPG